MKKKKGIRPLRFSILGLALLVALLNAFISIQKLGYLPGADPNEEACPKLYFPRDQLREWDRQSFPLLYSAIQHVITKETYVTFKLRDRHGDDGEYSVKNATFTCNGKRVLDRPIQKEDLNLEVYNDLQGIVVVCPPLEGPLNEIVIVLGNGKRMEYRDLAHWWNCQVHHHPVTQRLKQLHDNTNYGAISSEGERRDNILSHVVLSTMIRGAGPQAYLPQWVEYHRRVFGIGHIFVYVDEDWDSFSRRNSYKKWKYVTYVPFAAYSDQRVFSMKKSVKEYLAFFFQRLQQSDMLYRVKAFHLKGANTHISDSLREEDLAAHSTGMDRQFMGSHVQWVGMLDIDEYLYVPPGANVSRDVTHTKDEPSYRYSKYFNTLLAAYGPDSGRELAGIQFENVFYDDIDGTKTMNDLVTTDEQAESILLCDYAHKSIAWGPETTGKFSFRQKFFIRPDVALFANVHNFVARKVKDDGTSFPLTPERAKLLDPETELRQNHFKLRYDQKNRANVTDTAMKDEFCDWLRNVMN